MLKITYITTVASFALCGAIASAQDTQDMPPAPVEQDLPDPVEDVPMDGPAQPSTAPALTPDQQANFDGWPMERQTDYASWPSEAQTYYWTLPEARQEMFWMLPPDDRGTLAQMDAAQQDAAWTQIEGVVAQQQSAAPTSPEVSADEAGQDMEGPEQ